MKETFEGKLAHLKELAEKIDRDDLSLDETIRCYKEGAACYQDLLEILKTARQEIQIYEKEE